MSKLDIKEVYKNRTEGIQRRNSMLPCAVSTQSEGDINVANNGGCFKWSNQDKQLGDKELESFAQKYGYSKFHLLKDDFVPNSEWDAFKNLDGEVYFKAKTGKGNNFEPIFTGFTIK